MVHWMVFLSPSERACPIEEAKERVCICVQRDKVQDIAESNHGETTIRRSEESMHHALGESAGASGRRGLSPYHCGSHLAIAGVVLGIFPGACRCSELCLLWAHLLARWWRGQFIPSLSALRFFARRNVVNASISCAAA